MGYTRGRMCVQGERAISCKTQKENKKKNRNIKLERDKRFWKSSECPEFKSHHVTSVYLRHLVQFSEFQSSHFSWKAMVFGPLTLVRDLRMKIEAEICSWIATHLSVHLNLDSSLWSQRFEHQKYSWKCHPWLVKTTKHFGSSMLFISLFVFLWMLSSLSGSKSLAVPWRSHIQYHLLQLHKPFVSDILIRV